MLLSLCLKQSNTIYGISDYQQHIIVSTAVKCPVTCLNACHILMPWYLRFDGIVGVFGNRLCVCVEGRGEAINRPAMLGLHYMLDTSVLGLIPL